MHRRHLAPGEVDDHVHEVTGVDVRGAPHHHGRAARRPLFKRAHRIIIGTAARIPGDDA
jgi:hypothetical protein